ncbi:hypothetical protein M2158_009786 [Streptomyces sp. SAI-144]|nr:hypothetical protein [Streptomyces sp. SAI-144]
MRDTGLAECDRVEQPRTVIRPALTIRSAVVAATAGVLCHHSHSTAAAPVQESTSRGAAGARLRRGRTSLYCLVPPGHRLPAGWPKTVGEDGALSRMPAPGSGVRGPLPPIHLVQRIGRAERHRLRDAGAARPFRTLRRYNPWLHSPPMQQLGPKTNQQKTHDPSSGANAFDTPVESAWTTAAFVAVRPVGPASPTAERSLGSALLSPVRSGLQLPAVAPDSPRTGPGSAVINVTPGSVV